MDQIIIADLTVAYYVGVPERERSSLQKLLLTVEMSHDFTKSAKGDDLNQTIDYYAVTQRLLHFGDGKEWKLIEKLAVDIASMILKEFKPKSVTVEVKKFIIPEARHVAVRVTRRSRT